MGQTEICAFSTTYSHPLDLEVAWASDTGRVRTHNEDSFAYHPGLGLLVVADGLGGYRGGEVASAIAVHAIMVEFEGAASNGCPLPAQPVPSIVQASRAVTRANREVFEAAGRLPQYGAMASTVVLALFRGETVTIASVGDSRLYRLRGGRLQQLTVDHTVLQEQIAQGLMLPQQVHGHPARGLLTHALGTEAGVSLDVFASPVETDDLYLLCSDGLFDMLEDGEIGDILATLGADLDRAAAELVRRANERGGCDNITLMLARPAPPFPPAVDSRIRALSELPE